MSSNRWKNKPDGGKTTYYDYDDDDRISENSYNKRSGGGGGKYNYRAPRGGAYNRGRVRGKDRASRETRAGSYHYANVYHQKTDATGPDEDVDMEVGGKEQRFNPYKRPTNRSRGQYKNRPRHSQSKAGPYSDPSMQWYRISVYNGAADGEQELMRKLQELSSKTFPYRQFYTEGEHAFFYIRGRKEAQEVAQFSREIYSLTGAQLTIFSKASSMAPFSDDQMNTLQKVLMKRYDAMNGHLNLSCMYHEPAIRELNMPLKVKFTEHMMLVLQILRKIPQMKANEIVSLDLSDNQLTRMDGVKYLVEFAPNVKTLDLSKNFVREIKDLKKLEWDLKSLDLDENPLCQCERYESTIEYISDARDVFPDLVKLDCKELPPAVKLEAADQKLPSARKSNIDLLPNDEAKAILGHFITSFFNAYDDKRSDLRSAYDAESIFSITIPETPGGVQLNDYSAHARNLHKQEGKVDTTSKAHCGVEKIVDVQRQLPQTRHFMDSFVVDVTFCFEQMVAFVIHGLFQEGISTACRLRAFTRSFTCRVEEHPTPVLVILNEQLHVSNPTVAEQKAFAEQKAATAKVSEPAPSATLSPAAKEEMLQQFCEKSKMIKEFSLQCLEANGWDFDKSAANFLELFNNGSIPQSAFNIMTTWSDSDASEVSCK